MPFRLKIAGLSAAISGMALLAFGAAAWLVVSQQTLKAVDTEIRSLGARHPGWIASRGHYQRLDEALEFIFGSTHQDQVILLVKDADGTVLYTSAAWPQDLDASQLDYTLADDPKALTVGSTSREVSGPGLRRGRGGEGRGLGPGGGGGQATFTKIPKFQTLTTPRATWRLGMLGTADTTLVIGLNYDRVRSELNRLRNAFLLALPVPFLLVGLGGWLVAGRALRPLRSIAETAEHVTASGLDQRIPPSKEDPEIGRVIHVLNRMMDRLEASFRQATRFSADASHELKTPLAIMQGELEVALHSATPGSSEQRLFAGLIEETQRLKTITRSLLLLAQADAGSLPLAHEPVDLSVELGELIEDVRALTAHTRLTLDVQVQPQVRVEADRALLRMAFFNLLTNAAKYNVSEGRVSVTLLQDGNTVRLTVANTGPGIPPADQPHVFDRFYRVGRTRNTGDSADGIGLGLALAREIIGAHGGDLRLQESRPGRTSFAATLPVNR